MYLYNNDIRYFSVVCAVSLIEMMFVDSRKAFYIFFQSI